MERQLLQQFIDLQRQQLALTQELVDRFDRIAEFLKTVVPSPLVTQTKIYKQQAIDLLGISPRTYDRYKAKGILVPRGIGSDWYYPEDLEEALEESRRKGKI